MKILFITDNFPPEVNAPASRTFEHCREWVKKGEEVTVITCFPNFPYGKIYNGYKNKLISKEVIEGINIIRVWSFLAPNKGFFLRTLDFISFAISSLLAGLFIKTDIIVTTSPQFFSAISSSILSLFKNRKFVLEIRDMWPQQIVSSTNISNDNWIIKLFYWLSKKVYHSSDLIITVTKSFAEEIQEIIKDKEKKIEVVYNGVDRSFFSPREKNIKLIKKLNLVEKRVISYIGTHGLNQNLQFIVRTITKINNSNNNDIHFLFVGAGADKDKILTLSKQLNIDNITFVNQVSKTEVVEYLSITDISIVPLRNSRTYLGVVPSKIFENASMRIPILLGVDGESRSIIEKYGSGIYYEPENEKDFIDKLNILLKKDPEKFSEGCNSLANDFNRQKLALEMLEILRDLHEKS